MGLDPYRPDPDPTPTERDLEISDPAHLTPRFPCAMLYA